MDITLTRNDFSENGIFGELKDADGNLIAVTLEHAYPQDDGSFAPKIPVSGTFQCVRGMHQLEGMTAQFETFEITGIAGHVNILFHAGNYNKDSSGCCLLGQARSGDMIVNSKLTFAKFMQLQNGTDQFTLTVN